MRARARRAARFLPSLPFFHRALAPRSLGCLARARARAAGEDPPRCVFEPARAPGGRRHVCEGPWPPAVTTERLGVCAIHPIPSHPILSPSPQAEDLLVRMVTASTTATEQLAQQRGAATAGGGGAAPRAAMVPTTKMMDHFVDACVASRVIAPS